MTTLFTSAKDKQQTFNEANKERFRFTSAYPLFALLYFEYFAEN
jgi:hypothetical protein